MYTERLHPMMKYGNFIEVYNNLVYIMMIIHVAEMKKSITDNGGHKIQVITPCTGCLKKGVNRGA